MQPSAPYAQGVSIWECSYCAVSCCEPCVITWWAFAGGCPSCQQQKVGISDRMECKSCSHQPLLCLYKVLHADNKATFMDSNGSAWWNGVGVSAQYSRLTYKSKKKKGEKQKV